MKRYTLNIKGNDIEFTEEELANLQLKILDIVGLYDERPKPIENPLLDYPYTSTYFAVDDKCTKKEL